MAEIICWKIRRASASSSCKNSLRYKFTYAFFLRNQIKKFATGSVLEHDEDVGGCVYKFEVLDDVGMIEATKDFDLSLDFFEDSLLLNVLLV